MSDDKVQLLWSRSAVYIHPTKSATDNVAGYLSLVQPKGGDLLISWVPESLIRLSKQDFDSYVQVDLGEDGDVSALRQVFVSAPSALAPAVARSTHAFSVPLKELFSLQVREPSLGWWYGSVLLFTRSNGPLPALFFHDDESESDVRRRKQMELSADAWGGKLFLDRLRGLVKVVPSTLERGVFLVNPDPRDKRAFTPRTSDPADDDAAATDSAAKLPAKPPGPSWADVKWGVFEKLAQVTRYSRKASQRVFDRTPAPVKAMLNIPEVEQLGQDFDSARVYLAEWALGIAQDQEDARRRKVDVYWSDAGADDDFSLVSTQPSVERRNPVTLDEWHSFFDSDDGHLVITVHEVKDRLFHGGLEPEARPDAWLFLLGVYPWDSSKVERASIMAAKRNEYFRLKRQWWDDIDRQNQDEFWKDQKSRIEKDVLRTDRHLPIFAQSDIPHPDPTSRFASSGANPHLEQLKDMLVTYNEYNEDLGYVQGMTDLLSPLYVVFQDDAVAFTAFTHFMRRMERNFIRSQEGMRDQLQTIAHLTQFMLPRLYEHLAKADSTHFFFFFRMILVWFKREFEWDDVLRLWEVLWTDYYSSQFHLFIALAMLDLNKEVIMGRFHYFDEILKYINDLGMTMDLDAVLTRAEQLFNRFRMAIDLLDRQHTETSTEITDDLRVLLSKEIIEQRETKRPPGATGG